MKKIKLLIVPLLVLLLTGCKNVEESTDRLSKAILQIMQNQNADLSYLESEEMNLLDLYIESQQYDNCIVSLDDIINFSEENYTLEPNTYGVYKRDGKHYIKYSDINWNLKDGEYSAVITINNKQETIFKSLLPLYITDTVGNEKYNYRYLGTIKEDDYYNYYYKSIYDKSGLLIKFHINNKTKEIEDFTLIYQDLYIFDFSNIDKTSSKGIFLTIFIIASLLGVIYYLLKYAKTKQYT